MRLGENSDVVLIVDDVPDNVSVLHDALDESGYTVLVATSGEAALERAAHARPDVVLLDALMPGMDGFEVARRLKRDAATAHIPIVFMTGLAETEHVEAAFEAGGVDYVTKPIRPREVIARIAAHVRGARQARQARSALDAFGHAVITVRAGDGRVLWQTPLARELLQALDATREAGTRGPVLSETLLDWMQAQAVLAATEQAGYPIVLARDGRRVSFALHEATGEDEWLLVLTESNDRASIEGLAVAFRLTGREAEVLHWVAQGKTNRDIGDILGTSPRTVHKHLEHVFAKLGVETRTAAAAMALGKLKRGAA
ncbi:DNA-binding response regulator [Methylibium sp. Pch-M]|jgi:CheY-like chemotaxis protein|nr:response regulator transcription factor [Methylibium sp. Pch-M]QAZ41489.1 DNA-binding response regulator [Methylibium sp. Pch-M]